MIVRIVKMTFSPDGIQEFLQLFNESKHLIRHFDGCSQLDLLNDQSDPSIFFTYSVWDTEEHLNKYRNSQLFLSVWNRTKLLFSAKAEAWSVNKLISVS